MNSHVSIVAFVIAVVLHTVLPAFAASGDPRLVNGVLEWPRTLANEPFVVVRGDDGVPYYVAIIAARHDSTLAAGARVVVLGLEGRTPHDITALGIGTGETTEAALADLQRARPASPATAPAVVAPSPSSAVATTPKATVTPPGATPTASTNSPTAAANNGAAAVAAPAANAPSAPTQAGVVPGTQVPAPSGKVTAPEPASPATTPNTAAPTPNTPAPPNTAAPAPTVTAPAPSVTPATPDVGPYPMVISAPTPAPAVAATAPASSSPRPTTPEMTPASAPMPTSARDDRRWTEITGVVESVSGRTLVLSTPEGRVAVDMSTLSSNLNRLVTPGSTVRVYGVPIEIRFKAMGFVDSGARP